MTGVQTCALPIWTVVLEKTLESPLDCKEIKPVHSKGNQPWIFTGRTDAEAEALILQPPHVKSWLIWCWERLKAGGEGDDRGWNGWMASPIQWTWVWVHSGSWWRSGRPGVLQSMSVGSQRVRYDSVTEQQQSWLQKASCSFPPNHLIYFLQLVELAKHLNLDLIWSHISLQFDLLRPDDFYSQYSK